jgi:hypothetical protein
MASRSSRRRQREKRRKKFDRGVRITSDNVHELPRPLRLLVESSGRFGTYLEPAQGDSAAAATRAMEDACAHASRVAELAAPFDAFDVLESVRISQTPLDAETYKETEHEGSAAVVELAALLLAARGTRRGELAADERGRRPRPDANMEELLNELRAAVDAGSAAIAFQTAAAPGAGGALQLGVVLREVFVRNLSYTHMVEDTLSGLFGDPVTESDCRSVMGCTVPEIRAVFKALEAEYEVAWRRRFDTLRDFSQIARGEMARARTLQAAGDLYEIAEDVKEKAIALFDGAWDNVGDACTVDAGALSAATGIDQGVVARILALFSTDMLLRDPADAARDFFAAQSSYRTAPLIHDPAGDVALVYHGLLVPSIRERVESELKGTTAWNRYTKHRGAYLESEALSLLAPHFPGCATYSALEYFVPDPNAAAPQTSLQSYTKLVEGDGLLVLDDVAVIVEAKAGALTTLARTGDEQRLRSDLRKLVTDASSQCDRLRERITADGGLVRRDRSWLDLTGVREIYAIAVSLEDLSGVATVTSELVRAGLLGGDWHPWTVSLHDLRIASELIARPAELLLYFRRRTEPDVTRRFHAVDELDFFLEFYNSGLYVEPDPERVRAELPQLGEPAVATKRRFKNQKLEFLTSRTDQLDAWYFHQLGLRKTPAPKPRLNANPGLVALVDALEAVRAPGWLRIGTTLLDAAGPQQRKFSRHARMLTTLTAKDGREHTIAVMGGTRAVTSFVLVWSSQGDHESDGQAAKRLQVYVSAKKHQVQAAYAAGLLFSSGSDVSPTAVVYDNRRPGPDPSFDEAVALLRLQPLDRSKSTLPRATSSGRATPPKR